MKYVFETIQAKAPNAKIIVISPINCCRYGDYSGNWGIGYAFPNNGTLKQVADAQKEVCEYYGIEYVDMLTKSAVNRINIQTALPDEVHPSPEMHKQMASQLARYIT
jgi:lysophospholipase L1-like esterase